MTEILAANILVRRGEFELRVDLEAAPREVLAVIGPNGSGKSSLLGALTGTVPLASGCIHLAGRVLSDAESGLRVPVNQRGVGLLGQEPLLFPHLSAAQNVAFGLRSSGTSRVQAGRIAQQWLERIGLADLGGRQASELSGGQQQKVALARALAASPSALLLDEPLAALDVQAQTQMRQLLRSLLKAPGAPPAVLVSHDALDLTALADRALVLDGGRQVDMGPLSRVLARPATPFVAALAGVNVLTGVIANGLLRVDSLPTDSGPMLIHGLGDLPEGVRAAAVFDPAAVTVSLARQARSSARNSWPAHITHVETKGARVRLQCAAPSVVSVDLTVAAVAELGLQIGSQVWLSVKATEVRRHVL